MNNSKILFQDFVRQITLKESAEEISGMAYLVFEHVFGISKTDVLSEKLIPTSQADLQRLVETVKRINQHEPVQYILGEAEFFGRRFKVNPAVLIPRPETEELICEVKSIVRHEASMLDIGTGSGCIAITLALEVPGSKVFATDVSDRALLVSGENSARLGAAVKFLKHDILRERIPFDNLDVVVSNPPYITFDEKEQMRPNVVDFEPHLALFVPENDPLIFYKAITSKAFAALKGGGLLCVEINERFGRDVAKLFFDSGFEKIEIIRDLSGKERMVRGVKI
jgi:release factor glutamine methyltransferase